MYIGDGGTPEVVARFTGTAGHKVDNKVALQSPPTATDFPNRGYDIVGEGKVVNPTAQ